MKLIPVLPVTAGHWTGHSSSTISRGFGNSGFALPIAPTSTSSMGEHSQTLQTATGSRNTSTRLTPRSSANLLDGVTIAAEGDSGAATHAMKTGLEPSMACLEDRAQVRATVCSDRGSRPQEPTVVTGLSAPGDLAASREALIPTSGRFSLLFSRSTVQPSTVGTSPPGAPSPPRPPRDRSTIRPTELTHDWRAETLHRGPFFFQGRSLYLPVDWSA